jgi:hypothetical protein
VIWLPTLLLALAAGAIHLRRLPPQIFARAVWWQALLFGLLLALLGGDTERRCGAVLALASGAALLLAGRGGLRRDLRSRFAPIAFRGSLLAAIVMAMADAEVLLLWGGLALEQPPLGYHPSQVLLHFACAALMIVAVCGLYALRVWGLLLNLAANVGIALLALSKALPIPEHGEWALVATAAVQLLLPLPLLVAFFRKVEPHTPRDATWRYALTCCVIALLMVGATTSTALGGL